MRKMIVIVVSNNLGHLTSLSCRYDASSNRLVQINFNELNIELPGSPK